jgi:hypothetical protein
MLGLTAVIHEVEVAVLNTHTQLPEQEDRSDTSGIVRAARVLAQLLQKLRCPCLPSTKVVGSQRQERVARLALHVRPTFERSPRELRLENPPLAFTTRPPNTTTLTTTHSNTTPPHRDHCTSRSTRYVTTCTPKLCVRETVPITRTGRLSDGVGHSCVRLQLSSGVVLVVQYLYADAHHSSMCGIYNVAYVLRHCFNA